MPRRNEMGTNSGYYAAALDLRPARKKDESLRLSELRCRERAEQAGEWVWEVDAQGRFTYASPTVEKLLGYAPEDLVGRKRLRDLIAALDAPGGSETDEPTPRELIQRAFADAKPFHDLLTPELRKDGRVLWLSLSGEPVLNDRSEFAGFRGIARDFSARLAASGNLNRPNAESLGKKGDSYPFSSDEKGLAVPLFSGPACPCWRSCCSHSPQPASPGTSSGSFRATGMRRSAWRWASAGPYC
jgi:PAS domain S-box-containing protein